jgi:glycosyltransferase involved in cell wall biosynthesis
VVSYVHHLSDVKELVLGGDLFRDPRFYLPLALINNGIWGRLAAYRCQRYVVASRFQRAELVALGVDERRIVTLSNLIDREKLHPLPKQLAQRALLGEALRGPLIGWAGHFHHVKGVDALVEAFDRLSRARPSARLALAWSGIGNRRPVEARIRALGLEQRVVWLRRVDRGCFLAALDVLALPYRRTTGQGAFPNLVLEALAVGVPLVTSRLPLLTELLADSGAALLSPPDDPSAIAASCARLLDEPSVAQAQVTAQRALDLEFSSASLTGRYQELYSEVLAEAARRHEPSRHYARRG